LAQSPHRNKLTTHYADDNINITKPRRKYEHQFTSRIHMHKLT